MNAEGATMKSGFLHALRLSIGLPMLLRRAATRVALPVAAVDMFRFDQQPVQGMAGHGRV